MISGPEGTPYSNGLFLFDCYFPADYPNTPPMVTSQHRISHQIIWYYIIPYFIIPNHITPYHTIPYHTPSHPIPSQAVPCWHTLSHTIVSYPSLSHYILPYNIFLFSLTHTHTYTCKLICTYDCDHENIKSLVASHSPLHSFFSFFPLPFLPPGQSSDHRGRYRSIQPQPVPQWQSVLVFTRWLGALWTLWTEWSVDE